MLGIKILVILGLWFNGGVEFEDPVRIEAAGKPIDTHVGHSAPFVCDFNGDGLKDLLVGQFGNGVMWIYLNEGSNKSPRLGPGKMFKGGRPEGTVPTG